MGWSVENWVEGEDESETMVGLTHILPINLFHTIPNFIILNFQITVCVLLCCFNIVFH